MAFVSGHARLSIRLALHMIGTCRTPGDHHPMHSQMYESEKSGLHLTCGMYAQYRKLVLQNHVITISMLFFDALHGTELTTISNHICGVL